MAAFRTQRLIRFSHCDPAGIVFFVNFFEMIWGPEDMRAKMLPYCA